MALVSVFSHIRPAIRSGIGVREEMAAVALFCVMTTLAPAAGQNPASAAPNASSQGASSQGAAQAGAKSSTAGPRSTHPTKHSAHNRPAKLQPAPTVAAIAAPLAPPPDWPVNDKAVPPSVIWNGRDLTIAASNSSLREILTDVSTATGVKVEGEESDQRIFGSYGPAPARDVLNQLLDGSGYNVLIIGDKGEGTPRQLVLTARTHAASQTPGAGVPSRQNSEEDAPEEPEQPEQPNNVIQRRPFGLQPGQGRSPEQLQQEQQQRQQQLQQQPPQPNPQPPPNQ
jgi:hypothetical protein